MSLTAAERKLAENEIVFRSFNERVQKSIDAVNNIAAEEGDQPFDLDGDAPLLFCCECSDENCIERIKLSPNAYSEAHKERDIFTLVCGHEVEEIEVIIATTPEYCVVKKRKQPPESADGLNTTNVHNS